MTPLVVVLLALVLSLLFGAAAGWFVAQWAIRFHEADLLRRVDQCERLCVGHGRAQARLRDSIANAHAAVKQARADAARAKFLVDHAPRAIKRSGGDAA